MYPYASDGSQTNNYYYSPESISKFVLFSPICKDKFRYLAYPQMLLIMVVVSLQLQMELGRFVGI